MKRYNVVAICGKAGAGKDTLLAALAKKFPEAHVLISHTTRPKRDYEKDGVDYHFVTREEFIHLIETNQMLEAAEFNGWIYGTSTVELQPDKLNLGVFNPAGVESLMSHPTLNVLVILCDCPDHIRLIRQLSREQMPDVKEIIRRYGTDEADFADFNVLSDNFDADAIIISTDGSYDPDTEALGLEAPINDWADYVKKYH